MWVGLGFQGMNGGPKHFMECPTLAPGRDSPTWFLVQPAFPCLFSLLLLSTLHCLKSLEGWGFSCCCCCSCVAIYFFTKHMWKLVGSVWSFFYCIHNTVFHWFHEARIKKWWFFNIPIFLTPNSSFFSFYYIISLILPKLFFFSLLSFSHLVSNSILSV